MTAAPVERVPVEGGCPECGAAELAEYPVVSEGGWFLVRKCGACLGSVRRTAWNRLGYVTRAQF